MGKKLTYDYVKQFITQNGYTLLDAEYASANAKLTLKCLKGHEIQMRFASFQLGHRCNICKQESMRTINRKYSLEDVRAMFAKENYVLLDTEIIKSTDKWHVQCPNGHKTEISFYKFKNGRRCGQCRIKYTKEQIIELLKSIGYQWLDSDFINEDRHEPMNLICNNGHRMTQTVYSILNGHRCQECAGLKKITIDQVLDQIKKYVPTTGYRFVSVEYDDEYINNRYMLTLICPENHKFVMRWNHFKSGQRCPICAGNQRKNIEDIRKALATEGYTLEQEDYQNNYTPFKILCAKGHHATISWDSWQRGHRCNLCGHLISKDQSLVYDFVRELLPNEEVILSSKKIIPPLELDIYIPSKKIAIEYCGLYWHSEGRLGQRYHRDKYLKCKVAGIRLIQVFEDEWLSKSEIVKDRIRHMLITSLNQVYARDCECKIINNSKALEFCEKYHIQSRGQVKISYGLHLNNILISVMIFSRASIAKGSKEHESWEINRFCSLPGYSIVGGASKLFQHFIRDNDPSRIISFCDVRWGTGKVYEQLGMVFDKLTKPNYYYVLGSERKHRFNFKKDQLVKDGADPNKTERQIMAEKGAFRIYDAGHLKYVWKRPNDNKDEVK